MKRKFCRDTLSLLFLVLLFLQIPAQQRTFKVGDVLPEDFWTKSHQIVNSSEKSISLSDHRGKLILLDFWNTWCSACLIAFPKMEKLQEQFGDQIFIQAVTGQDRLLLDKFFSSKNGQRFKGIKSVTEDKYFNQVFPHIGEPFIVWIKDGKVVNTTDGQQVTSANITEVLKGHSESLQTVISIDRKRPFMLDENFDRQRNVSMLNYSIFMKGHVPGIGSGGKYKYSASKKEIGRQFTNLPLSDIFFGIGLKAFNSIKSEGRFNKKRMILNLKDPSKFYAKNVSDGTFENSDLYSFEHNVPDDKADSLYVNMLDVLDRYSNYNAKIKVLQTDCLVLKRTTDKNLIATKGGKLISTFLQEPSILQNAPIWHMVNMINGNTPIEFLLIDETDIAENVDLKISGVFSVEQLIRELAPYGLTIVRENRPLEMLVISEK
ncbi:TlpA family protein disulfide reductase [Chryseobacterium sp. A301]